MSLAGTWRNGHRGPSRHSRPGGVTCPARDNSKRHRAAPPASRPSDGCLRCGSERLKSPPMEVIDGQFPPMANGLSPGGPGEGRGSRRNLTCPLVPVEVLRPAPFSEPPVSGAAMLVRRNHRYGHCPNPRVAARRPPAPTPQPPAANTD